MTPPDVPPIQESTDVGIRTDGGANIRDESPPAPPAVEPSQVGAHIREDKGLSNGQKRGPPTSSWPESIRFLLVDRPAPHPWTPPQRSAGQPRSRRRRH